MDRAAPSFPTQHDPAESGRVGIGLGAPNASQPVELSSFLQAGGLPLQQLAWRLLHRLEPFIDSLVQEYFEPYQPPRAGWRSAFQPRILGFFEHLSAGRHAATEQLGLALMCEFVLPHTSPDAAARFVEAFEYATLRAADDPTAAPAARELGRFLLRVALRALAQPMPPSSAPQPVEARREHDLSEFGLIGHSPAMQRLARDLSDVATAPGAVLLVGESGTGKELVARALHQLAGSSGRPFQAVNCAALPRDLVESELFGRERGAIAGNAEHSQGLMRAAGTGTLFLDDVTEMPINVQAKLLRALEQRAVRPVGGLQEVPIRARVVGATNREPEHAIETGALRPDLFFRLCVHRVTVPPLRDRAEDIAPLATYFLNQLSRDGHRVSQELSPATLARLREHSWPGNVRELRNVIEHGVAVARGARIEAEHLPRSMKTTGSAEPEPASGDATLLPLRLVEQRHIAQALQLAGGNKTHAARLLGLSRHQLYVRLSRLGL